MARLECLDAGGGDFVTMGVKHLLESIIIGYMEVQNRIVMPPIMDPVFATDGGVVSKTRIIYHET